MAITHKIYSSRSNNNDSEVYVGEAGRLFYAQTTGTGVATTLRYSDGVTPGGLPLTGESISVSGLPPEHPYEGNLWYDDDDGRLYIYYDSTWVDASPDLGYTLRAATTSTLGGVKVDGATIVIDEFGVISAVIPTDNDSTYASTSYVDNRFGTYTTHILTSSTTVAMLTSDGTLTLPSTGGYINTLYTDNGGSRSKLEKKIESTTTTGVIAKLELDLDNTHIRLAIGNYENSNSQWIDNTWAFGADGILTLPNTATITNNVGDITIESNTGFVNLVSGPHTFTFDADTVGRLIMPDYGLIAAPTQVSIFAGNTQTEIGKTWTFNNAGNLTFPVANILASTVVSSIQTNGNSDTYTLVGVVPGEVGYFVISLDGVAGGVPNIQPGMQFVTGLNCGLGDTILTVTESRINPENTATWLILQHDILADVVWSNGYMNQTPGPLIVQTTSTAVNLAITVSTSTWAFGADGILTFPDSTTQTTAWTGSTDRLTSTGTSVVLNKDQYNTSRLTFTGSATIETAGYLSGTGGLALVDSSSQQYVTVKSDRVQITTGFPDQGTGVGSFNEWRFLKSGVFKLPTTGIIENSGKQWTFSSTGTLTFPDGYLKIVPNGANPYISNRTDNGLGLVSGSTIQIRQSVADNWGITINSSTTDTGLGGGAELAIGSNIDVNGTRIVLGKYTVNNLDANNGLTGQNKIEINNDAILIGPDVSTLADGVTTSAFVGWTFSNTGTVTFPDATVQTTAYAITGTIPTSSTSTGITGQISSTGTDIYICVATNSWLKVTGSTF